MQTCKAFVCGCSGLELGADERAFLRRERPWGLILFRRNISHPAGVRRLVEQFRDCVGRPGAPVLVDQEGGRVQRLGPPHWPAYPPAAAFARIAGGLDQRIEAVRSAARCMAEDLAAIGVTIDCMPVLDVPAPGAHQVIGDRAYSDDPSVVAALARAAVDGMLSGRVLPVVKHLPGHGRAGADSHQELPVVRASRAELEQVDFAPFKALADAPIGMTAHVLYEALDRERPATLSARIVQGCIREEIGFGGLLLTDDLSMRALGGSFEGRTSAAFAAGVDIALHCNGDLQEASAVASASPILSASSLERAERALAAIAQPAPPHDRESAMRRVQAVLARASQ